MLNPALCDWEFTSWRACMRVRIHVRGWGWTCANVTDPKGMRLILRCYKLVAHWSGLHVRFCLSSWNPHPELCCQSRIEDESEGVAIRNSPISLERREKEQWRDRQRWRMFCYIKKIIQRNQRMRNKTVWERVRQNEEGNSVIRILCQSDRLAHWVKWCMTGTKPSHMHTRTITPSLWITHVCNRTPSPPSRLTDTQTLNCLVSVALFIC